MGDSIEWMTCCRIIEKIFDSMIHREKILKNLGIAMIVTKKNKKSVVSYVLDDAAKQDVKISRWQMYNAITQYLTHGEHITPHIESLYHLRAEKILTTPIVKLPKIKAVLSV